MTNFNPLVNLSKRFILTTLVAYSSFSIAEGVISNNDMLSQSLSIGDKIKPTLIFENNSIRLFGEDLNNLNQEKSELLNALAIFNKKFGPTTKLDVVLMNSQLNLLRLDSSQLTDNYFSYVTHQGQLSAVKSAKTIDKTIKNIAKSNVLGHELCHKLLIKKVSSEGLINKSDNSLNNHIGYGHTLLPDWFDEIAAVMCENQHLKTQRISNLEYDFIPFRKYLKMEHPVMAQEQEKIKALMEKMQKKIKNSSKENENSNQYMMIIDLDEKDELTNLATKFYSQTTLFAQFLQLKLGDNIFRALTNQFTQGVNVEKWILNQLKLENTEQLDAMFKTYVQSNKYNA